MFVIGLGEIIVLAALALLVFGRDHLPKAAAQAGRFVRDLRTMAASARKELSDSADLDGISGELKSLADLHPKRILTSVWEDPEPGASQGKGGGAATGAGKAGAAGAAATPTPTGAASPTVPTQSAKSAGTSTGATPQPETPRSVASGYDPDAT